MMSYLGSIIGDIVNFFTGLTSSQGISFDMLFIIGLVLEAIFVVFFLVKSMFSYEMRLNRSMRGLSKWLYNNQYINETNLLEFNARIKKAPRLVRYHWQQYMLYREKDPSNYLSAYNLIEKPLKTSSYLSNIKNLNAVCYTLVVLMFALTMAYYSNIQSALNLTAVIGSLITPLFVLFLNTFFVMFLRAKRGANLNELYQNHHLFCRFIDKAATTLPEYVDFEILFTKEEIKKGIPVLNEYLEKRARQEKEELEKAKRNAIEHERYDFTKAGIDGSQVLDRAMKETEFYINIRQRMLAEIQQLESEIESFKKNYDNSQREYQRKMQASKENLERLRKEQEESTNRIETNYLKKQQTDEIKKQEQLEKDYDDATVRFTQEVSALNEEIEKRKAELEERRKYVETAMYSEYQTFSTKLYENISEVVEKNSASEKIKLKEENEELEKKLEAVSARLSEASQSVPSDSPSENPAETNVESTSSSGDGGYYDAEGNYRYANGAYYDKDGIYHDEFGGYYDKDGKYHASETKQTEPEITEPQPKIEEALKESFGIGLSDISKEQPEQESIKKAKSESVIEEPKVEEVNQTSEVIPFEYPSEEGGYESEDGFFIYADGSYKDTEGNYYDANGNLVKSINEIKEAKAEIKTKTKKRGRPKKEVVEAQPEKKGKVGRPKKEKTEEKKPSRPVGRPKKEKPVKEKRPVGRPKKVNVDDLNSINNQITDENKKLAERREELSSSINQTLTQIEKDEIDEKERDRAEKLKALQVEADELANEASIARNNSDNEQIDKINKRLSELLTKINEYKSEE